MVKKFGRVYLKGEQWFWQAAQAATASTHPRSMSRGEFFYCVARSAFTAGSAISQSGNESARLGNIDWIISIYVDVKNALKRIASLRIHSQMRCQIRARVINNKNRALLSPPHQYAGQRQISRYYWSLIKPEIRTRVEEEEEAVSRGRPLYFYRKMLIHAAFFRPARRNIQQRGMPSILSKSEMKGPQGISPRKLFNRCCNREMGFGCIQQLRDLLYTKGYE